MAAPRDYYEVLGVSRDASEEEIRSAYRRLARKYHPDVSKEPDAADRFSEITEAYDVLVDPEKRKAYDQFGHAWQQARSGPGPGHGYADGPGGSPFSDFRTNVRTGGGGFDAADIGSIFEEMFGGRAAGGASPFGGESPFGAGARQARPRPRKGQDLRHAITVSFMTAAKGGTERLRFADPADGEKEVSVRIPVGIESGAKLRLKGRGHPGSNGGPAGDLILSVNVGEHPWFRREGLDVMIDVPITIAEAALGATVETPLLSGRVDLRIPAGSSSGRKIRIPEKGIKDDASGRTGDFFAVVRVVAPEELDDEAKRLVEALQPHLKNPRQNGPWST